VIRSRILVQEVVLLTLQGLLAPVHLDVDELGLRINLHDVPEPVTHHPLIRPWMQLYSFTYLESHLPFLWLLLRRH